jgi:hypothetical protein
MHAFISYQTEERQIAGRVAELLATLHVTAFMAHEHIEVSQEWRLEILRQLADADVFIPILSERFYTSIWCKQESGVAAFRNMTIIPLSIDGSIPQGFFAHVQCVRIDPAAPAYRNVLPGLARHNVRFVIDAAIDLIGGSRSFRSAEANFQLVLPYLAQAERDQIVRLLTVSAENNQVCHAADCAREYLPPLLRTHGRYLDRDVRETLAATLSQYEPRA